MDLDEARRIDAKMGVFQAEAKKRGMTVAQLLSEYQAFLTRRAAEREVLAEDRRGLRDYPVGPGGLPLTKAQRKARRARK